MNFFTLSGHFLPAAERQARSCDLESYWKALVRFGFAIASNIVDAVRIDKWLWAARFFKTRAQASRACELGRILSNGLRAKPSREVRIGDRLHIENDAGSFDVEALEVSGMRGPAPVAHTLYRETDVSREARLRLIEERKAAQQFAPLPEGRPSKRDRRRIIQFRRGM
jgi:ribosome-associated heat shock protein Hsp15